MLLIYITYLDLTRSCGSFCILISIYRFRIVFSVKHFLMLDSVAKQQINKFPTNLQQAAGLITINLV